MKLAVIADVHLGTPKRFNFEGSRTQTIVDATLAAMRSALSNGCTQLVVAGDFLDKRRGIDTVVMHAARHLASHMKNLFARVYILEGNHEYLDNQHTVLSCLPTSPEFLIVKEETLRIQDNVFLVPYTPNVTDALERIDKGMKHGTDPTVISHFPALGAVVSSDYSLVEGVDLSRFQHIKRFILGDIHRRQRMRCGSTVVDYVGAPLQHNFGEAGYKVGYAIFDTKDRTLKFVNMRETAPQFIKFEGVSEENAIPIIETVNPQNFYWFACVSRSAKDFVLANLGETVFAVATVEQSQREGVRLEAVKQNRGLLPIFKEYVSVVRKDIPLKDRASLLRMFKDVYKEVQTQLH